MKNLFPIFFILVFFACKKEEKKIQFESSNFEIIHNGWDTIPYKFLSQIENVKAEKGNQYVAGEYSYIGDQKKMLIAWDGTKGGRKELSEEEAKRFEKFKSVDAVEYILEKAKEHQVTIINEAHQMPSHRVFTATLLEGLYAQGYRYLGMETLTNHPRFDSTLNAQKYPTLKSGYYTKEPQFGNLVRIALKMGFQLFGYESHGHENSKGREINQARNIEAFLKTHTAGKTLIHCGFDHAAEGDYGRRWEKAMAGRLTEFTGIDPLTINQTTFSEKSSKKYEAGHLKNLNLEKSIVFIDEDGNTFQQEGKSYWYDIFVFHPRTKNFDRPEWLFYNGKKEFQIPLTELDIDCPCRVMAYKANEPLGEAIPIDVIERDKSQVVKLMLEKGDYNIIITNQENKSQKAKIVIE